MISVVVPAFNESDGLRALHERLTRCAAPWNEDYEILIVDDGSRDDTLAIAAEIAQRDPRWKVISLSRNFGHQAAITAGLEHARGDLVAIIDADLQDPPEELARFFARCREGFDVVYGIRTRRKENLFKRTAYAAFYRILASLANIEIPLDSGDFCVMSRRVVDALHALPDRSRFVRGLRSWVGFRQSGLTYERHGRHAGQPKYTLRKLTRLALDGIINFSSKPLQLISLLGMAIGVLAVAAALLFLVQYLADWTILGYNPRQARGWTSLILAVLFLSSVQLFCLGILGEYVGRLFEEIKGRPLYLVQRTINLGSRVPPAPSDAERLLRAARGFALLAAATRAKRSERYATRAMKLLHRAVARGCTRDALTHSDFESLRDRSDFRKLLDTACGAAQPASSSASASGTSSVSGTGGPAGASP
jgi:dolichol-phosphate mannosyltransferase